MKNLIAYALAMTCMVASAEIRTIPVVKLDIEVQVTNEAKVCKRAVEMYVAKEGQSQDDATKYLQTDGELRAAKCLSYIFANQASPTNGWIFHAVGYSDGNARVEVPDAP